MQITKITAQKQRQDRYSVYVDGAYAFSLSAAQLAGSGLSKNQPLTSAELHKWQAESEFGKAYERTLKYLALRPRSEYEVETYLAKKSYPPAVNEQIVARLKKGGYLDDRQFARAWVEWRLSEGGRSKRQIGAELIKKRVPREVIDEALAAIAPEAELANLKQLISRKQRQSRYQEREKLIGYLSRKGFNYGLIKQALEELASGED